MNFDHNFLLPLSTLPNFFLLPDLRFQSHDQSHVKISLRMLIATRVPPQFWKRK